MIYIKWVSFVWGMGSRLSGVCGCWEENETTYGIDCLAAGIHFQLPVCSSLFE